MDAAVGRFLEALAARGRSKRTITTYRDDLGKLVRYLAEHEDAGEAPDVTREALTRFQGWLYGGYVGRGGKSLCLGTQRHILAAMRSLFAHLAQERLVAHDPASSIELPRVRRALPRGILSEEEVERLLEAPDVSTPTGIRDRAILEVFYGAGIRRSELFSLKVYDVDVERAEIRVDAAKKGESRVIPVPEISAAWVRRYLEEVRPLFVGDQSGDHLFLSRQRRPFRSNWIVELVRRYARKAGIAKDPRCHGLRHTYGTHLLRRGMGIRHIQRLLGHRYLSSTQFYTQLDATDVKEAFHKAHPRSRSAQQRGETAEGSS